MSEEQKPEGTPPETPPAQPPVAEGGLPQEEVNRIAAKVRAEGHAKAREELLAELGISDTAEAAKIIANAKAAEMASMSEAERAKAEAEAFRAEAQRDRDTAAADLLRIRSASALQSAGLQPDLVQRLAPTMGLGPGATDEEIASAVAMFKAESPSLFGTQSVPPAPAGVPANNRTGPANGTGHGDNDEQAKGKALYERWNKTRI